MRKTIGGAVPAEATSANPLTDEMETRLNAVGFLPLLERVNM
jgi:hypothetical protein